MYKYIDPDEANKMFTFILGERLSGKIAVEKELVKKALKCCSNPSINYCKDCPYANYGKFDCCNGKMCKDTLDLITEQEKEIERLKKYIKERLTDEN